MLYLPNLAGDAGTAIASIASRVVQNELFAADIPSVSVVPDPRFHEVMSRSAGVLEFEDGAAFGFQRAAVYYAVRGTQALPHGPCAALNERWGTRVRIGGESGGSEDVPLEGVNAWHVDTLDGLQALSLSLIHYFGSPHHRIVRTVAELTRLGLLRDVR